MLLLGKEGKKRKMLIDIKTIIEDIIKIDLKIRKKSTLKERNMIDTEKMTLFVSNGVKKDILVNIVTFKER